MSHALFPVGGFVLVGGRSRRMGGDKAFLELEGRPLFLRAARLLHLYVPEVVLLGPPDRYSGFGFRTLSDRRPGRGPLEALCTGLANSPYEWNLFLACDLPLVEGRFLEFLLSRAVSSRADAVVPCIAGRWPRCERGWQPLCAAYHRRCLPALERALEEAGGRVMAGLQRLLLEEVKLNGLARTEDGETIFANVNTPHDWQAVRGRLLAKTG